jgi:hypothetical protein
MWGFASLFLLAIVSCAQGPGSKGEGLTPAKPAVPLAKDVLSYRPDAFSSIPSKARIFLIAGGNDCANYAQEVVDQIQTFQRVGFKLDDIACYFTIPGEKAFGEDIKQYTALAGQLRHCYPANPKMIWSHLSRASQDPTSEFLYVYASSHGAMPLSDLIQEPKIGFPQKLALGDLIFRFPELNQHFLRIDAGERGESLETQQRIDLVTGDSVPVQDHFFTPRYLKKALGDFRPEMPKIITIQACYSGNFLDASSSTLQKDTLRDVPNVSVMTASRHDRSSFGCNPGAERTFFGHYYGQYVEHYATSPAMMDWKEIYDGVSKDVASLEETLKRKSDKIRSSEPQFFSNFFDVP